MKIISRLIITYTSTQITLKLTPGESSLGSSSEAPGRLWIYNSKYLKYGKNPATENLLNITCWSLAVLASHRGLNVSSDAQKKVFWRQNQTNFLKSQWGKTKKAS